MYWKWTKRGFFSEFNLFLYAYYIAKKNNETLFLDVTESNLGSGRLTEYFPYFHEYTDLRIAEAASDPKDVFGVDRAVFDKRAERSFKRLWNQGLNRKIDDTSLSELARQLFKVDAISTLEPLSSCIPKNPFIGIHVRRGDKLINEADYIPVSSYLDEVKRQSGQAIFVSTDDQSVIEELNNDTISIHWNKNNFGNGHNQNEFNNLVDEGKTRAIQVLLADVFVLLKSDYFVGDYASNIARFVAIYRGHKNVKSIGKPFTHYYDPGRQSTLYRFYKYMAQFYEK